MKERIYYYIFILIYFFCIIPSKAQDKGTITGIVIDAKTLKPLQGAVIKIDELKETTVTDSNGYFKIDIYPGTFLLSTDLYIINDERGGTFFTKYQQKIDTINVISGQQTLINFSLNIEHWTVLDKGFKPVDDNINLNRDIEFPRIFTRVWLDETSLR